MKEKITNVLNKIKENKRIILKTTISVLVVFIFAFSFYNLNNPTYFNKLLASIGDTPANDAFEDKDFYSCVVESYNNQTGESRAYTEKLEDDELNKITSLECDWKNIESTSGIEKLTGLETLHFRGNYNTKSINLSSNAKLKEVDLSNNNLKNVDLSNNTELTNLNLNSTQLTDIDLSNNTNLTNLDLGSNQLTHINLSNNTALTYLNLNYNKLTDIDLSNNTELTNIALNYNKLTNIDLSNNTALTYLNLNYNELTDINLSNNMNLTSLDLSSNQLTNIDLSNNSLLTDLNLSNNLLVQDIVMIDEETYTFDFSNIILSNELSYDYTLEDENIATIENNVIRKLKDGKTYLNFRLNGSIFMRVNLNIGLPYVEFYYKEEVMIDEQNNYIYLKESFDEFEWKDIRFSYGNKEIKDNKLKITYNNAVLREFDIAYLDAYGVIDEDYFMPVLFNDNPNEFNINSVNCDYIIDDENKEIVVKYGNKEIDRKKIIYLYVPKYYRIVGSEDFLIFKNIEITNELMKEINDISEIEQDKINVLNAKIELRDDDGNYIYIYNDDEDISQSFYYSFMYSKKYDLANNYIYLGTGEFENDVVFFEGEDEISKEEIEEMNLFRVTDDAFEFWNVDEECDDSKDTCWFYRTSLMNSWAFIKVTSDKYDMNNDVIKLKDDEVLDLNSIKVTNATLKLEDSKLLIMYDDEIVKEFKIEGGKKEPVTTKPNAENNTTKKNTTTKKSQNVISKTLKNTKKASTSSTSKVIVTKKTTTKVVNSTNKVTDNKVNKNVIYQDNILLTLSLCLMTSLVICLAVMYKKRRNN